MAAIMEIEFKFCIPAGRLKAVEAALRRGTVARTRLQAYIGTVISDEYDLEGTAEKVPEFKDLFLHLN